MEIRKLVGEERDEADLIWLQAFQRGTRSALGSMDVYRGRLGDRLERFGLWDSGGLQATFEIVHSALPFGPESVLPTGYISFLACLPAGRGRGYGGAGIAYLLQHMRDAGQVASTLQPFDFDYYRRFGWEWICTPLRTPGRSTDVDGRPFLRAEWRNARWSAITGWSAAEFHLYQITHGKDRLTISQIALQYPYRFAGLEL